jgi:hypothetical protein
MPAILAIWKAEIKRIMVPGHPEHKNFMRLHLKGKIGHGGTCPSSQQ